MGVKECVCAGPFPVQPPPPFLHRIGTQSSVYTVYTVLMTLVAAKSWGKRLGPHSVGTNWVRGSAKAGCNQLGFFLLNNWHPSPVNDQHLHDLMECGRHCATVRVTECETWRLNSRTITT